MNKETGYLKQGYKQEVKETICPQDYKGSMSQGQKNVKVYK